MSTGKRGRHHTVQCIEYTSKMIALLYGTLWSMVHFAPWYTLLYGAWRVQKSRQIRNCRPLMDTDPRCNSVTKSFLTDPTWWHPRPGQRPPAHLRHQGHGRIQHHRRELLVQARAHQRHRRIGLHPGLQGRCSCNSIGIRNFKREHKAFPSYAFILH